MYTILPLLYCLYHSSGKLSLHQDTSMYTSMYTRGNMDSFFLIWRYEFIPRIYMSIHASIQVCIPAFWSCVEELGMHVVFFRVWALMMTHSSE